ncbi:hypothetical protein LCGC14_2734320, partial [marine sediment metagenome]
MSRARTCTVWSIAVVLSGLALPTAAWAGFMALPIKAELDLAKTVVVGKIVGLTKERTENRGMLVWGRATIAVERVLKGKPAKQVTATVAMRLAREWGGQSP